MPTTESELAAFWAEVERTIAEGDLAGYAAGYHPDAVLVSDGEQSCQPVADALVAWKPGFDDSRDGRVTCELDVRITRRLHDATTAHETGIFRFRTLAPDAEPEVVTLHFEAVLVKRGERWLLLAEHQRAPATDAEWEAAAAHRVPPPDAGGPR